MQNSLKIYIASKLSTGDQLIYTTLFTQRLYCYAKANQINLNVYVPYADVPSENDKYGIAMSNKMGLMNSDVVIAILDSEGQGTVIEACWAYYHDKILIIFSTDKNGNNINVMWNAINDNDKILFIRNNYMNIFKLYAQKNPSLFTDTKAYEFIENVIDNDVKLMFEYIVTKIS